MLKTLWYGIIHMGIVCVMNTLMQKYLTTMLYGRKVLNFASWFVGNVSEYSHVCDQLFATWYFSQFTWRI